MEDKREKLKDIVKQSNRIVAFTGASLPEMAKREDAKLVIINIDPTPLDDIADLVIHDSVSKVLSKVMLCVIK